VSFSRLRLLLLGAQTALMSLPMALITLCGTTGNWTAVFCCPTGTLVEGDSMRDL